MMGAHARRRAWSEQDGPGSDEVDDVTVPAGAITVLCGTREQRRRLFALYRGALDVDDSRLDAVIERTEGVTASFLKELLRRAAVVAVEREPDDRPHDGLRVGTEDVARLEGYLASRK